MHLYPIQQLMLQGKSVRHLQALMVKKPEPPKGHLRDLRFMLLCSTVIPFQDGSVRRTISVFEDPDQYRQEMAAHRVSSTASKRRRASPKKGSAKPSASRTPRSRSSKAKTAAG